MVVLMMKEDILLLSIVLLLMRCHSVRLQEEEDEQHDEQHEEQHEEQHNEAGDLARTQNINISDLLDQLLLGYDNHLRPDFGGPPTEVFIDLHVRSMGPVSEIDMTYVMDCYFRQMWTDRRLAFNAGALLMATGSNKKVDNKTSKETALALSIYMLEKIWKPPTYFLNGKHAYMHTITLPNKFVRIYTDGRVLFSARMTIKASCPMNLENFPMDTQRCPLVLGSFGYSIKDMVYRWNPKRKVVINSDMRMSQFDLISTPVSNDTDDIRNNLSYSILTANFHFRRHMGSFVIEVYAPCMMLVTLSWVSFWINREATADRVTLVVTTVLTMTFLGLESRNDLPKVSYWTALDYFVALCFAFISAAIVEFAVVHYFTKIGSGEFYFSPAGFMQLDKPNEDEFAESDSDQERDEERTHTSMASSGHRIMTTEQASNSRMPDETEISRNLLRTLNGSEEIGQFENIAGRALSSIASTSREIPMIFHRQQSEIYSTEREHGFVYLRRGYSEPLHSQDVLDEIEPPSPYRNQHYEQPQASTSTSMQQNYYHAQPYRSQSHPQSSHLQSISTKRAITSISSAHPRPTRLSSLRASIRAKFSRKREKSRRQSISFQLNSVSKIDRCSRVIFPLAFLVINLVYWYTYLRAEIKFDEQQHSLG